MVPFLPLITGVIELIVGCLWLAQVIRRPPADQPPKVFIGRVLMPVCPFFFGVSMLIQPSTALTTIPSLIGFILTFVALYLQIRYRPQRV
jgi:hypothetical protein